MKVISILLIVCLTFTGCSTMFGRQNDDTLVTFDSNVRDAEVRVSGKTGYTPCSIPLRQSQTHKAQILKEGYRTEMHTIKSGVSGAGFSHSTATNFITWGWWTWGIGLVIGWGVDLASGAMKDLKEEDIYVELREQIDELDAEIEEKKLFQGKYIEKAKNKVGAMKEVVAVERQKKSS